jgi:hypothetical protein
MAKQSVLQSETTSADQAATDLAAWKLLALRRQAYLDNPSSQTAFDWQQALETEAIQVQGDHLASQVLAAALKSNNDADVKAAVLTAYNRAATDRVFADALSQAMDDALLSLYPALIAASFMVTWPSPATSSWTNFHSFGFKVLTFLREGTFTLVLATNFDPLIGGTL